MGQLPQRQRVSSRLAQHPVADLFIQRPPHHRGQQLTRVGIGQALETEIGQPAQVGAELPAGDDQEDGFGQQAACGEHQRQRRRSIQPLRIIDQAHQRSVVGRRGQQAQHRQADEELIRCRSGAQAQCGSQGIALWLGSRAS